MQQPRADWILLVEPSNSILRSCQKTLSSLNYNVTPCSFAVTALNILFSNKDVYSLVICSTSLSNQGHVKLYSQIHNDPQLENLPILFLNDNYSTNDMTTQLPSECSYCPLISFPFTESLIKTTIKTILKPINIDNNLGSMAQLRYESVNAAQLQDLLSRKEMEIQTLQKKLSETKKTATALHKNINLPLVYATESLRTLLTKSTFDETEMRTAISKTIKDIGEQNAHHSSLETILERDDLDSVIKEWLHTEFVTPAADQVRKTSPTGSSNESSSSPEYHSPGSWKKSISSTHDSFKLANDPKLNLGGQHHFEDYRSKSFVQQRRFSLDQSSLVSQPAAANIFVPNWRVRPRRFSVFSFGSPLPSQTQRRYSIISPELAVISPNSQPTLHRQGSVLENERLRRLSFDSSSLRSVDPTTLARISNYRRFKRDQLFINSMQSRDNSSSTQNFLPSPRTQLPSQSPQTFPDLSRRHFGSYNYHTSIFTPMIPISNTSDTSNSNTETPSPQPVEAIPNHFTPITGSGIISQSPITKILLPSGSFEELKAASTSDFSEANPDSPDSIYDLEDSPTDSLGDDPNPDSPDQTKHISVIHPPAVALDIIVQDHRILITSFLPADETFDEAIKKCRTWTFDPHKYTMDHLLGYVLCMWEDFDLFRAFNMPVEKAINLLQSLEANYNPNPYHSWYHAIDVTQAIYVFTTRSRESLSKIFSLTELLCLFISALSHDVGHPGFNNSFQIAVHSPLAILYNDNSVLENHHCALTSHLLTLPGNDILHDFSDENFREIRRFLINAILATDMTLHFDITTEFNTLLDACESSERTFGISEIDSESDSVQQEKFLLGKMLIKLADISNPSKPFPMAKMWADLLQKEWFNQSAHEKDMKIPITPFMNPETSVQKHVSQSFIEFCCLPAFQSLVRVLPELEFLIDNINSNYQEWSKIPDKPSE